MALGGSTDFENLRIKLTNLRNKLYYSLLYLVDWIEVKGDCDVVMIGN